MLKLEDGMTHSQCLSVTIVGDIQVTVQNVPSAPKAPRTFVSLRGRVELPEQYTSPYSRLGVSFGAPQDVEMSAATSEGEPGGEADDSADRYPSAVAAPSETDAELLAMLLRAAKEIGLEVPKTPLADPSRLDDWFLGRAPAALPHSPPVPFFPEVHEELVRTWRAPHSSRPRPSSSPLASLDGSAARGYEAVPQVESAVAVHLCPRGAATWRDQPHLPSKACKFSSALAGRTYHAAGQAATALHAMATLQVYQAKVLKHLHDKGPDQGAMEELRAATDFALRATKVTARSLGQVMSTIVVQEQHLWLTLAQMADVDKSRFLDAPISQGGLFGDTVEDFAQQFSAVQKQTEAIKHILPCRDLPSTSTGPPPPPARRRGRPPVATKKQPAPSPAEPDVELPAGEGRRPCLRDRSPEKDLRSRQPGGGENRSLGDDNINVPTPGGGPGAAVCSDAAVGLRVGGTHKVTERANFLTSGVQAPSSLFEQRPRSVSSDSEPDVASAGTREEGKHCSVQSDFSPGRSSFWDQSPSPSPPRLPHRGHVGQRPFDTPGDQAGSLASASQPLAVVDSDGTSRLCDSVRQASVQVQSRPFHFCPFGHTCRCASCGGCSPTGEGRNRACPSSRDEVRVLQSLLHRAQKERWVKTHPGSSSSESVPSQAAVQDAHDEAHANMHSSPGLVCSHRPEGRVLSCLDPASTQTLPTVCFRAYQYKVLPFGLSLSPRVFTKVAEAALSPLWQMGIRILNYLDDWLLIAHSRDLLCEQRDLVLRHLSHLGLQVNREKSKLSPVQRISFLGVELDSVSMTARLTNERAQSVLKCMESFRHKTAVPLKTFQRLLGHMAAAATVTPLGLLHMRPLQRWLHDRVPRWAWHRGTLRIGVSPQCRRLFSPWSDPAFLQAGVPLGQVSRHLVEYTDASSTGWGAVCNRQAASGSWTGPRLQWHINCLELLAVLLALRRFRPTLRHKHVLVRTDSTATVAYINRQGADQLSRQSTHPGEWRLHPETVQLIWSHFREAQIDLFASPRILPLPAVLLPQRGSQQPQQGRTGTQLASGAQVRLSPSEPPCTDTVQDQGGRGAGSAGCAILAHPDLVSRTHFPRGSPSLENPLEERPSFSGDGHNLAPAPRPVEPARLVPGRDASDLSGLPQAVIETITQSRAPSTRQAYALRWGLFVDWCSSRGEDPQRCTIAVVLSFLQEKLERRLFPSTLKVYVAAIAAYRDAVDGTSLGKHQLIVRFLRGARRVNPPQAAPHTLLGPLRRLPGSAGGPI
ncbi:ORF V: Enzymatic polyprotein [Labeo rohita]|uniref:ribonuclease H n=1 Tax=Labeo rohita TaxID=84645 RepID=A0ABQ8LK27_LABRO|nr:ORF V: Enzymatic polyprotein [Labeo rohita]